AADAACNERRILLVAADDRLDLRIHQRVEYGIDLCSGDTKDMGDALSLERSDNEVCTGLRRVLGNIQHTCLLVSLLCVGQFLGRVFAEVSPKKGFRFRKRQVKACQRLDFQLQRFGLELEQMPTVVSVGGKEMEVIAGDAECACESRRPQADKAPVDMGECELALRLGGVDQPRSRLGRIYRTGPHPFEVPIEPKG